MSTSQRGFAALKRTNPKQLARVAASGGKAAHVHGGAHEWTSEEAREAGRKGGLASARKRLAQERSA